MNAAFESANKMAQQICGMPPAKIITPAVDANHPKRTSHTPDFYSHVAGIPCGILIGEVNVQAPQPWNDASDQDCKGCREIEFTVLDDRGYEAPWLQKKITAADTLRIELFILAVMEVA